MGEPQYDQSDADLFYTMKELREWRHRADRAEATLAAIRVAARDVIDVTEAWMRGPLMQRAGIKWEHEADHPPALRQLRALLDAEVKDSDDGPGVGRTVTRATEA